MDGAGAGGSSPAGLVGSRCWKRGVPVAEAVHVRAEPHLDHLKEPRTPGMWVDLGRVRSSALGRDFVFGGVSVEVSPGCLAAAVIGYFEF